MRGMSVRTLLHEKQMLGKEAASSASIKAGQFYLEIIVSRANRENSSENKEARLPPYLF